MPTTVKTILAVVLALAAPATVASARSNQEVESAAEETARELERVAWQVFEQANAKPSDDSSSMLKSFIRAGADRLRNEDRGEEGERDAKAAIRRFAEAMVEAGERQQRRNEDGSLRLGEGSFGDAQARLCPLYPFC